MKSLDFLDNQFKYIKEKGIAFETGSITPRTASKKVVLDEVKISEEAKTLYQEILLKKVEENFLKLNNVLTEKEKEIKPLKELVVVNEVLYKKSLEDAELKCNLMATQIQNLKKSSEVQVKEFNRFSFETLYQEDIEISNSIKKDKSAVLRYGLDTESKALNDVIGSSIEKGILHPYEEVLFDRAFEYLKMVESAENYLNKDKEIIEKKQNFQEEKKEKMQLFQIENKKFYPNNVVLVDIFDRSSGFINGGNNQTHTIALWKKKDDEIVLIDPSQKSYSEDLVKPLSKFFTIRVLDCKSLYGVAVYKGNEVTGYSEYSEIKPKPRDCVDIAIKICFELNEQQKLSNLDKITDNMLQQISNEAKNAPHLTKLSNVVIRELQSSNFQTRTDTKKVVNIVNECIQKQQIQGLQINKIKNYQDILEINYILSAIKKFC